MEEFTQETINESNYAFAEIVARQLNEPPIVFYMKVLVECAGIAVTKPVARYNHSMLFLNQFEPAIFADKVYQTL